MPPIHPFRLTIVAAIVLIAASGCQLASKSGAVYHSGLNLLQTQSARAANVLRSRDSRMQASRELSRSATELARSQQTEKAIQAYSAAIELFPSETSNYVHLANLFQQQNKLGLATEQLSKGLSYDPNAIALHLKQAEIYLAQRQADLALRHADQVLQLDRNNALAWRYRADGYLQKNQIKPAMAACFQALAISPDDEAVLERVCQIYFQQGRPMRAWSIVQKMSAKYSDENRPAKLRLLEAETLVQMDRNADAINTLKRWYQDGGSNDANCCNMLAWCMDRENMLTPKVEPAPYHPFPPASQFDNQFPQIPGGPDVKLVQNLEAPTAQKIQPYESPQWNQQFFWNAKDIPESTDQIPWQWKERPKFRPPTTTSPDTEWR